MGAPGQYQASATHRPDGRVTAHIHSSKRISYCTYLGQSTPPALHELYAAKSSSACL